MEIDMSKKRIDPEAIVTTFDGSTAIRKRCKYILGDLYEINRQCFKVEGRWHRINNGLIIFNHSKSTWVLKKNFQGTFGVVDITDKNFILGFFEDNEFEDIDIIVNVSKLSPFMFEDFPSNISITHKSNLIPNTVIFKGLKGLTINSDLKESKLGYFYMSSNIDRNTSAYINNIKTNLPKEAIYSFPYDYGAATNIPLFSEKYDYINPSKYSDSPTKYTFGVEFETAGGIIPERFLFKNGLIGCRDGSITGFEYVTIPLSGDRGIQTIINSCKVLQKYCFIDEQLSTHIHLGGFPKDPKYIVSLYRLLLLIQDDIYSLFPKHYRKTSAFKRRDYCAPLDNVPGISNGYMEMFGNIYEYLSGNTYTGVLDSREHPLDTSGRHKWNVNPRYKIVNLVPLIWGERGTVEFRVHLPTLNQTKVIMWLFICMAILEAAETHVLKLTKPLKKAFDIDLMSIINNSKQFDSTTKQQILAYIELRKKHYSNGNDPTGIHEIIFEQMYYESEHISPSKASAINNMYSYDPFESIHSVNL